MPFHEQLLQYLVTGLTNGAIYALLAVGFVVIYNVTDILNFAQGENAMLGALLMITLHGQMGWPLIPAFALAVGLVALLGGIIYRLILWPARNAPHVNALILTLGVSIVIKGLALIYWGSDPYTLEPFTRGRPIHLLSAIVPRQSLWVLGTTVACVMGLYLFFQYTRVGRAVRACAVNRLAAPLMGINLCVMATLTFALGSALGAVGGAVVAPITLATYAMGSMLGLKGIVAALMGGLTSTPRALAGGLLLGVLEAMAAGLISSGAKNAIAFAILVLILFLRPGGLAKIRLEAHSGL
ncbi:branched-chain amino acid ABC transporter permease [Chloroflexota bacterium]